MTACVSSRSLDPAEFRRDHTDGANATRSRYPATIRQRRCSRLERRSASGMPRSCVSSIAWRPPGQARGSPMRVAVRASSPRTSPRRRERLSDLIRTRQQSTTRVPRTPDCLSDLCWVRSMTFAAQGPFEQFYCLEVLEHLYEAAGDRDAAVFARAAAPGAELFVTTPNARSAWPAIEWTLDTFGLVPTFDEAQHLTLFSANDACSARCRCRMGGSGDRDVQWCRALLGAESRRRWRAPAERLEFATRW